MPRTRSDMPREDKRDELLDAAERRVRHGGYDELSIAAIARELGLAQNAVYWYFPSKDHLFVGVLERIVRDIAERKPSARRDIASRVIWFTDQYGALAGLRSTLTSRSRHAPVVAEFVAGLDALTTRMLSNALRDSVPEDEVPDAVAAFKATVEGTYHQDLAAAQRRRVLRYALGRLLDS